MMFRLVLLSLSLVHSLPIEDTEEVAAAKAEFAELFAAAEAGDHAALAPVNSDVQASQIPAAYIEDTEDVAAAKAAFNEAFEEAKSGGLASKQAAAPVHVVANHVAPTFTNLPLSYHGLSYRPGYSYYAAHHAPTLHHPYYAADHPHFAAAALQHHSIPAFGLRGLPYNGLPYSGLPSYNGFSSYNGLPSYNGFSSYNGIPSYAYTGLPSLAYNTLASASAEEEEE